MGQDLCDRSLGSSAMALCSVQTRKPADVLEKDPIPRPQDDVDTIEALKSSPTASYETRDFPCGLPERAPGAPNRVSHDLGQQRTRGFLRAVEKHPDKLIHEIHVRRGDDLATRATNILRTAYSKIFG